MLYKSDKLWNLKLLRYYNICGVYKFMNGDCKNLNLISLLQPYLIGINVQEFKWI